MTKNSRTSKQYFIDTKTTIKSRFGTLNKNNAEVLYIRSKGKVRTDKQQTNFSNEITSLKSMFALKVQKIIDKHSDILNSKYIASIDMSDKGLIVGKSTFIKYDLFIRPIVIKKIEEYEEIVTNIINEINVAIDQHLSNLDMQLC